MTYITMKKSGGLAWNDQDVAINWTLGDMQLQEIITSEKDAKWPTLKELSTTDLFKDL